MRFWNTPWQSRIVGHDDVAPSRLIEHPSNFRTHPPLQREALAAVLRDVGWVTAVIVNRTTGHLLDGHLRVALALERGEPTIPVTYVDLTADEERLVLATLDPIAALAGVDAGSLTALLGELHPTDKALDALLAKLAADATGVALSGPALADPDDVPQAEQAVVSHSGDTWVLGRHRLLCGDATDGDAVRVSSATNARGGCGRTRRTASTTAARPTPRWRWRMTVPGRWARCCAARSLAPMRCSRTAPLSTSRTRPVS